MSFAVPLAIAAGTSLIDKLTSKSPKLEKLPTMIPEQEQGLKSLLSLFEQLGIGLGGEGGGLSKLFELLDTSSGAQERFAQPYMRQFQQQTVPQLAERFAGMGGGALSSSGFGQALGGAASDLQSNLAGLKSELQRSALQDILGSYQNLGQLGLSKEPFAYKQTKATPGAGSTFLDAFNKFYGQGK